VWSTQSSWPRDVVAEVVLANPTIGAVPTWPPKIGREFAVDNIASLDCPGSDAKREYMKSETPRDTLIPPDLLPAIQAAAEEERRAPRELVTEAVERYLSERRWFRKDEIHAKIAQGLESLRQGKGLDGETVMAELLAELDASQNAR
jgi:antitoxin ParD1/3/4